MKIRDSGMPEEQLWETFFDPHTILTQLGLTSRNGDVVDFGCGYGTFTIAAAQMTSGIVYGLDIEPMMLEATEQKAAHLALGNIRTIRRDFMIDGTGLEANTIGYAMLFNVLHTKNPVKLLREAYRILVPGSMVAIIHWNYDTTTPRGPALDIRPRPQQGQDWMIEAGFARIDPLVNLPPYHYGIVGEKPQR